MPSSATSSATSSTFNLDTYISNYSGHTRQKRFEFIAAHSEPLQRVALERALEEVKQTSNTTLYNDLIAAATALDPEHFQRDDAWVEAVDKVRTTPLPPPLNPPATQHADSSAPPPTPPRTHSEPSPNPLQAR